MRNCISLKSDISSAQSQLKLDGAREIFKPMPSEVNEAFTVFTRKTKITHIAPIEWSNLLNCSLIVSKIEW